MPAACGIACEICGFIEECGGCVPGTDPQAPERAQALRRMMGAPCSVFECAIKDGVDYCLRCGEFHCEHHYRWEIPYSKRLLNIFKDWKEGKYTKV